MRRIGQQLPQSIAGKATHGNRESPTRTAQRRVDDLTNTGAPWMGVEASHENFMELRHEPSSHITNTDTIKRGLFFYTRKEAADYAKSIGWPKSSARLMNLPHGRQRWAISDDHLNIILQDCNPHELGFCCRYASGQTCVGCGDAFNGHEPSQEQIESELDLKMSEGLV